MRSAKVAIAKMVAKAKIGQAGFEAIRFVPEVCIMISLRSQAILTLRLPRNPLAVFLRQCTFGILHQR